MEVRFRIVLNEIRTTFLWLKSYWLDWAAGIINLLLLLFFLNLGINSFNGNVISGDVLNSKSLQVIIGLYAFILIEDGLVGMVNKVTEGKTSGVFEQMIVNPYRSWFILFSKSIANIIINIITINILVPIVMVITGNYYSFNFFIFLLLCIPLCLSTTGIGFILGGLTLIFRRLNNFSYLIQFLVLSLMVLPSYPFSIYSLLPIAPQSMVINKVMASNLTLNYKWWMYIYFNGFVYFIAGIILYNFMEEIGREKGLLGHY